MDHLCQYGCGNPGIVKNKSNHGWRCSRSPNSCTAVKLKKQSTVLEKYGVTNISKSSQIKQKKQSTWLKNYGVDNPSKADVNKEKIRVAFPDILSKRKKTMLDKYGKESYSSTKEFDERRKTTWLEKYGVDNPTKNLQILQKVILSNAESNYRTKTLVLPSGMIIRYQGYEDKVILELLKSGIKEKEIVIGPGKVPHIMYTFKGESHIYYPDIFIPKYNQIIEVKSKWTWKKYKEKNLAKRQACIDAGFNVNIVIR